ncbi:uncharacterized protein Dvar_36610 [Desulfosarcina variabilis str. Montpellier]
MGTSRKQKIQSKKTKDEGRPLRSDEGRPRSSLVFLDRDTLSKNKGVSVMAMAAE